MFSFIKLSMILIDIAMAFPGQPKVLESTYEAESHAGQKQVHEYRVVLPDIKPENLRCFKQVGVPGLWQSVFCSAQQNSKECQFDVYRKNSLGGWGSPVHYKMMGEPVANMEAVYFSATKDCRGDLLPADYSSKNFDVFSLVGYVPPKPHPGGTSSDYFFNVAMNFSYSAEPTHFTFTAYESNMYEKDPSKADINTVVLESY